AALGGPLRRLRHRPPRRRPRLPGADLHRPRQLDLRGRGAPAAAGRAGHRLLGARGRGGRRSLVDVLLRRLRGPGPLAAGSLGRVSAGSLRRLRRRPHPRRAVRDRPAPVPRPERPLVPLLRPRRAGRRARRRPPGGGRAGRHDGAGRARALRAGADRRLADLRAPAVPARTGQRLAHARGPGRPGARRSLPPAVLGWLLPRRGLRRRLGLGGPPPGPLDRARGSGAAAGHGARARPRPGPQQRRHHAGGSRRPRLPRLGRGHDPALPVHRPAAVGRRRAPHARAHLDRAAAPGL
ncbi:MAG: GH43_32 / GH43 / GH43_30 / GH43_33 / GH43 _3 / GH43_31 / GH43_8 / GH43_5 / GH43_34 / GH43_26 / GH43_4 / GH43_9, partial [uncultured Friedmanniella sp.]